MGGNDDVFIPQFSRLDANYGSILLNKNGAYEIIENASSGLVVKGVIKSLTSIEINGKDYVFIGLNDTKPKLYEVTR